MHMDPLTESDWPDQGDLWFEEVILPFERELRVWLANRFPSLTDVDDLVQEAFFKVIKAKRSGPIVNPRAYLFLTARHLALGRFRKLKFEAPPGSVDPDLDRLDIESETPLESVARKEEIQMLLNAIRKLPRRCRQVIALRKIYGYSLRETAKVLGISVKTVDAQSAIALGKISEFFRTHGYGGEDQ